MDEKSVPTASKNMLQPSTVSSRNELTNGALSKFHSKSNRVRSKSESHHQAAETTGLIGVVVKSNKDKNDRKPRNLKGNGRPKKAGGGGKGTWGKNGEVYEEENEADPNDPNYDDQENQKSTDIIMTEVEPDLNSAEFDKVVTPIIQEYLDHTITGEVCESLSELNISHLKHRVVYLLILIAMERKGSERELTSVLLSDLFGSHIIYEQDFELGFQALMNGLEDMKLDTPDAPTVLGRFMARCVADDCLNPCYIKDHMEHPTAIAKESLSVAQTLLSMKHGIVRLDTIWGFGGGIRPVKLLIKEMNLLIKEFVSCSDLKEAERCLKDLDVPHFHHELVYEAIMYALDSGSKAIFERLTNLLKHFSDSTMITDDQMKVGFERVFNNMDDIVLDIPWAHRHLDAFMNMCCRAGAISLTLRQKAPVRGRKRFVSEGDFGMGASRPF